MNTDRLNKIIAGTCKKIAPAWPLENSVAVNPFLGLSDLSFDEAAEILDARSGIQMYMPLGFYFDRMQKNEIKREDIDKALQNKQLNFSVEDFLTISKKLKSQPNKKFDGVLVADLVSENTKTDYAELMVDQVSVWLALYFDKFKSKSQSSSKFFEAWKEEMQYDLLPELNGLSKFRKHVAEIPNVPENAIHFVVEKLGVPENLIEAYLHAVLLKIIGWASYCSGEDWQNNLYGGYVDHTLSLLAMMVSWEYAVAKEFYSNADSLSADLEKALQNDNYDDYLTAQSILQESFEIASQRSLKEKLENQDQNQKIKYRPKAQVAFCIDVRSEIYRSNLENTDPQIETIGFAGFFGIPLKYQPITGDEGKNQCPVLIPSGPEVYESMQGENVLIKEKEKQNFSGKMRTAWNSFKSGTVSSFSFVSPLGLFFLPKLFGDSMGWSRPVNDPKKAEFGKVINGKRTLDLSKIPFEEQLNMAHATLCGMGLTRNFAPLVLFAGHGSSSVNNPHATGLDCGACGGNSGEVNAIVAEMILNSPKIRKALFEKHEVEIPEDTLFVACLHDTTTDEITLINEMSLPETHLKQINELKQSFAKASKNARNARSKRLVGINQNNIDAAIFKNAKDWSQVRPEWGLAGCNSFIVAPRERTRGIDLNGKSFLHSYNWKTDQGFKILETIMTAPMIVTSWINLQYYASTTDNEKLGAGNKTLHNVIGGMGVIEGAKGDLRIGLPMQSIFDGNEYQHLPQKLNVIIEAPKEAINEILRKHDNVKELLDNQWIKLMIMNEKGKVEFQYDKNLSWKTTTEESVEPRKEKVKELVEIL